MDEHERLAQRFEENRTRMRAVAYRLLGSFSEADDAVQEAWPHLSGLSAPELQGVPNQLIKVESLERAIKHLKARNRAFERVALRLGSVRSYAARPLAFAHHPSERQPAPAACAAMKSVSSCAATATFLL